MRPHVLKLRSRFVLFVLAGVGLITALMGGITFFESREALVDSRQEQLFDLAQGQAAELGRRLVQVAQATRGLAAALQVFPKPDEERLHTLIRRFIMSSKRIYGIGVAYAPYAYQPQRKLFAP